MNRVSDQRVATEWGRALAVFPEFLRRYLGCDLFVGDHPFAGLHKGGVSSPDGRSYRTTAHVCYEHHARDRRVTVVIPSPIGVAHTVHELGHVLDHALGFEGRAWPVTRYADSNRRECFAEFVAASLVPGYLSYDPTGKDYVAPQRWAWTELMQRADP